MGRTILKLLAMAIIGVVTAACSNIGPELPAPKGPNSWAIENIQLVDVEQGKLLQGRTIVVEQGRIAQILVADTASDIDSALPRIDGQGRYLIPGLVDMHVHVYDRRDLVTHLAYGVTTVRNLRGMPMHLRWREELQQGQWLGARLYTASPALSGPRYAHALQQVVETEEHVRRLVRRYQRDGYDMIKAYGYLDAAVYAAMVDEAATIGMPIAKHAPHGPESLPLSSIAGLQSLEHVEDVFQGPLNYEFDTAALQNYIDELARYQPNVTPTLATFYHLMRLSEDKQQFVDSLHLDRINPFVRWLLGEASVNRWLEADAATADWNRRVFTFLLAITGELYDAGIPLLVGSDMGTMYMTAGDSTLLEMALMHEAGIPASAVLSAATLNPAQAMGLEREFGRVATGLRADLVLLQDNPLEDIRHLESVRGVMKEGIWLDNDDLQELRQQASQTASGFSGLANLLEDIITRWWH